MPVVTERPPQPVNDVNHYFANEKYYRSICPLDVSKTCKQVPVSKKKKKKKTPPTGKKAGKKISVTRSASLKFARFADHPMRPHTRKRVYIHAGPKAVHVASTTCTGRVQRTTTTAFRPPSPIRAIPNAHAPNTYEDEIPFVLGNERRSRRVYAGAPALTMTTTTTTTHSGKSTERHVSRVSFGYLGFLARTRALPPDFERFVCYESYAAQYVQRCPACCCGCVYGI